MSRPLGGPGYPLVERTSQTIRRYGMLDGGETVVVAASGGPDSTCLLDVLDRLSSSLDLALVVAHVDHGLSEPSERVAARVATSCADAGYDVHVMRIAELEGPNLHARARELRYGFFENVADQVGAARIATAHTLDDRVETTVARLLHGAPLEGLAGIPPVDERRIRPLIASRRSETRAYCEERSLEFFEDPANVDLRFERPAVRARVLAPIEDHWGDGAVRAMATAVERLREDAAALSTLVDRIYPGLVESADAELRIELDGFLKLPRAFRRRVLERAVGRIRDRHGGIDAVLDALDQGAKKGARYALVGGFEITVAERHLVVRRAEERPE